MMMAAAAPLSEVEAVLEFLRKNGFLEAENALKQDIVEKSHLGMFDFEKFLFPMVPLPPPVRIPASSRRPETGDGGGDGNGGGEDGRSDGACSDGDDQFVSLGSSTSDVCSSEFVNPYGLRSTSIDNSEASSDRMSQFGTARDYHDFDMQNDLWYDEKEDGHFLTPSFQALDAFGCPSEDKHVMSSGALDQLENSFAFYNDRDRDRDRDRDAYCLDENMDYLDKPCLHNTASINEEHKVQVSNGHTSLKKNEVGFFKDEGKDFTDYDWSDPLWKRSAETREFYDTLLDENYMKIKQTDSYNLDIKHRNGDDGSAEQHVPSKSINGSTVNGAVKNWMDQSRNITSSHSIIFEKDYLNATEKWDRVDDVEENRGTDEAEPDVDERDDNDSADEILIRNIEDDGYEVFDLRIIHRKNRTGFEENKDLPIVLNTVIAGRYYVTEYLGSAAFSRVVQAHDLYTGMDVSLKIIKNDKDFFDQSLDEIKLLKLVNKHDPADERHILRLYDYFYHQEHLFIVCELLRANLYEFQKFNQESGGEAYFTLERIQVIARQCLEALEYLHDLGIIHCDLKPENVLIKSYRRSEIKVIDLGSSCFNSDNLCLYVQSRSYRAPEVMLGLPYDEKIDIWSLGCILAELYSGEVLFPNDSVVMILARMIGMLGPIDLDMLDGGQETAKYFTEEYDLYYIHEETTQLEYIIPEESSLENHLQISDIGFLDFLRSLLEINPKKRPTAREALEHPWLSYDYSISC